MSSLLLKSVAGSMLAAARSLGREFEGQPNMKRPPVVAAKPFGIFR
jgi:hypothetical protein